VRLRIAAQVAPALVTREGFRTSVRVTTNRLRATPGRYQIHWHSELFDSSLPIVTRSTAMSDSAVSALARGEALSGAKDHPGRDESTWRSRWEIPRLRPLNDRFTLPTYRAAGEDLFVPPAAIQRPARADVTVTTWRFMSLGRTLTPTWPYPGLVRFCGRIRIYCPGDRFRRCVSASHTIP